MKNSVFFRKSDLAVLFVIIVTCLILFNFFMGSTGDKALIMYDSNIAKEVYLNKNLTFSVDEAPEVVFQVKDGEIAFIHSDCPDKVCVRTGFISKSGESAACLPNKLMIVIEGGDGEIDAITARLPN